MPDLSNLDFFDRGAFEIERPSVQLSTLDFFGQVEDLTPPEVSDVDPPEGAVVNEQTVLRFTVTDNIEFRRVVVIARLDSLGLEEVVHNGDRFAPMYANNSSVSISTDGLTRTYAIRRTPGWPVSPAIDVIAIDANGNEAA